MKKILITLSIVFLITNITFAEGKSDSTRYLETLYNQNWFLSANTNINMWRGSDRNPNGHYTGLNGPTFGFGVAIGKYITHNLALRLAYDNNEARSYLNGLHLTLPHVSWLIEDVDAPDENGYFKTKFFYHNIHFDAMISPIDLIQGYYDPDRFYTPVLFAGMGAACVGNKLSTLASDYRNFELSFDAGLLNDFMINRYFDINIELRYSVQRWNIDSWFNEYVNIEHGIIRPREGDEDFAISFGITYYLGGRIYELPYNYERELYEMKEKISQLERDMTEAVGEPRPCDTIIKTVTINLDTIVKTVTINSEKFVSYPFSIFFHIDSYELMSRRDIINLNEIAKVAKENNLMIKLTGSADSATANPPYNQTLSENRCRKIAMELTKLGIPNENIITDPIGGVKILDPTKYDRRVLIELLKREEK